MDVYYVCVDDGDKFVHVNTWDNYHDAVIAAIVASKKYYRPAIALTYDGIVIYRIKP